MLWVFHPAFIYDNITLECDYCSHNDNVIGDCEAVIHASPMKLNHD